MLMSRYSHRGGLIAALAFGLGLAALPRPALSLENGSLTVQWDANTTDSDLSGYRVFLSTDSSVFSVTPAAAQSLATTRAVSASTTQTTFSALDTTKVYYIAVTCFDLSGNESVFSNVVSTQPSTTPTLAMVSPSFAAQGSSNLAVTLD